MGSCTWKRGEDKICRKQTMDFFPRNINEVWVRKGGRDNHEAQIELPCRGIWFCQLLRATHITSKMHKEHWLLFCLENEFTCLQTPLWIMPPVPVSVIVEGKERQMRPWEIMGTDAWFLLMASRVRHNHDLWFLFDVCSTLALLTSSPLTDLPITTQPEQKLLHCQTCQHNIAMLRSMAGTRKAPTFVTRKATCLQALLVGLCYLWSATRKRGCVAVSCENLILGPVFAGIVACTCEQLNLLLQILLVNMPFSNNFATPIIHTDCPH